MIKDDFVYIEDILISFNKILAYVENLSEKSFYENEMVQDAVIRKFEIAGEAVKNLSNELREKYSNVPWKKMAGLRDKLIHDYAGVDSMAIWDTIRNVLPNLVKDLEIILNQK